MYACGIYRTTALDYIKRLGFISKLSVWILHELSEKILMDRILISSSNLSRHKRETFVDHLVTGDVKWMVYNRVVKKRAYVYKGETPPSISKAGVLLSSEYDISEARGVCSSTDFSPGS
ncbi:hypothetical protein TNCV_2139511 [Trichonephila clavipes]|uniref:Uncharacterized protein n=1 Tax=Trichonephila clavipes TaxID=2585209 RepID=A0A8X6RT42_TRICX|nr:hypothetical protein TNCV_2139511 [Trichonephila clavipes]